MKRVDAHAALKVEVAGKATGAGVEFTLTKLTWGKDDFAFSLHGAPTTFTTSGFQTTDFLAYLGFNREACSFTAKGECYSRFVAAGIDLSVFGSAFEESFKFLREAQQHLEACGFFLGQPEGWGYFYSRPSDGPLERYGDQVSGDGHTSSHSEIQKQAEDENFGFALSWVKGDADKGWTTHFRPKQLPLSPEIEGVFSFLQLRVFANCPIFDFEPCYWRFTAFQRSGEYESNAGAAHRWFGAPRTAFLARH